MEKTTNDTIHDTILVYVHQDVHDISDSTLVEEVLHRYDRVAQDIKSNDPTATLVTLLTLIALIVGIVNRRYKNKKS